MATKGAMIIVSLLLAFSGVTQAVTTAECTPTITSLFPCLGFVSGDVSTPPTLCCDALKPVVTDSPACLCVLLGYGNTTIDLPTGFNQTTARTLPTRCSVSANEAQCPALVDGSVPPSSGADGPSGSALAPKPQENSAITLFSSLPILLSCLTAAVSGFSAHT